MSDQVTGLSGMEPDWFEQASTWIHAELESQGIRVTGPIEQAHLRHWSTVWRVPSDAGDIYFKAPEPVLAYEVALTNSLSRWYPNCMPPLLGVDIERGWMLMPDLGTTMRSLIQSTVDLAHWQRVLPIYAKVQIDLAGRTSELLELGALDRRLATLPDQLERLMRNTDALLIDKPNGLTTEEYRRLLGLLPEFATMCNHLAAYQIPETIHHEDFHDANIFVRDGRYTFSDWGESGVSHPFCTLLVTFRVIAWRLELAEDAAELERLRDVYLEQWTEYGALKDLRRAFGLAYRVAMVCRALTWHRIVAGVDGAVNEEDAEAVPGWLQELLEAGLAIPS